MCLDCNNFEVFIYSNTGFLSFYYFVCSTQVAASVLYVHVVQLWIKKKIPAMAHLTNSCTSQNVILHGSILDAAYNILRSSQVIVTKLHNVLILLMLLSLLFSGFANFLTCWKLSSHIHAGLQHQVLRLNCLKKCIWVKPLWSILGTKLHSHVQSGILVYEHDQWFRSPVVQIAENLPP